MTIAAFPSCDVYIYMCKILPLNSVALSVERKERVIGGASACVPFFTSLAQPHRCELLGLPPERRRACPVAQKTTGVAEAIARRKGGAHDVRVNCPLRVS